MKTCLITTQHRGVFFGRLADDADITARTLTNICDARMAIYWGTTKGVMELANSGPTSKSRIGAPAKIDVLHDVTAVFEVSPEAEEKWMSL